MDETEEQPLNIRRKLVDDFTESRNEKMQVYLRIRPFKEEELKEENHRHCLTIENGRTVLIRPPLDENVNKNVKENMRIHQRFSFSQVFGPDFEQKEFFDGAVLSTVRNSLQGETCLLFAYGATNSGKTYTIQGNGSQPGIIPRALAVIFKSIQSSSNYNPDTTVAEDMADMAFHDGSLHTMEDYPEPHNSKTVDSNFSNDLFESSDELFGSVFHDSDQAKELLSESVREDCEGIVSVWVSFSEIYNENIYDLLEPLALNRQKRRNLKLAMDRSKDKMFLGNHIKGLRYVCVNSVAEACRLLKVGRTNLHFASNKLNQQSSRSHCIYTVYMIRSGDKAPNVNSLTFCDLAGLERVTKTQNTGARLKEAGNINTSLLVLGRCIQALREKRVVPYRDSKLTRLFQGYFTSNGKASMIVNVGQSSEMFADTLHVLKFSASAQQVVSIDNFDRTRLWYDQSSMSTSGRMTDLWPMARQRWSEYSKGKVLSQASSIPEESQDGSALANLSVNTQEEPGDLQEFIDLFWKVEAKNQELMQDRMEFEIEIRREVCQEFQKMMADMDKRHNEMLKSAEERNEELMDRRLSLMRKNLIARYEGQADESDTTFDCTNEGDSRMEVSGSKAENSQDRSDHIDTQERHFLNCERQALLEEKQSLAKEMANLISEVDRLQLSVAALEKSNSNLAKENASLSKECVIVHQESAQLVQEKSRLQKLSTALATEKESLTSDNASHKREIDALQKAYESLLNEKLELEKSCKSMKKEKASLAKTENSLTKEYESLKSTHESLLKDMDQLRSVHDEDVEKLAQMEKNLKVVQARFRKLESAEEDNEHLVNEVRAVKEKNSSLEAQLHLLKTDDFEPPKKMTTRGRKRAAVGTENVEPEKTKRVEKKTATTLAVPSPLATLGQAMGRAIRQSPTFKAMENAVGRVVKKIADSASPILAKRTRRKLYCQDANPVEDAAKEPSTEPPAATTTTRRLTRRKK